MSTTTQTDLASSWRDELLTTLVPHAVHRLGNLLTVVMGTTDLLALDEVDPKRRAELDVIGSNVRRATDLIRALGLHARSEPGEVQAMDLRDVAGGLAELASPVAKAAGLAFELREASGVTVVRCDPVRMQLLVLGVLVGLAAPGEGLLRQAGTLSLRAVELGTRVALLVSVRLEGGTLADVPRIAPRAAELAAELCVRISERTHPESRGRTVLLGLPGIG